MTAMQLFICWILLGLLLGSFFGIVTTVRLLNMGAKGAHMDDILWGCCALISTLLFSVGPAVYIIAAMG